MLPEHAIVGTGNIILDKERYTVYTQNTQVNVEHAQDI